MFIFRVRFEFILCNSIILLRTRVCFCCVRFGISVLGQIDLAGEKVFEMIYFVSGGT